MKLFRYKQFLDLTPLNENLDKAKKFLKETELVKRAATELKLIDGELADDLKHGDKRVVTLNDFSEEAQNEIKNKLRELRLTDDEVRKIERDPNFLKIRELLGPKNIGWTYPFTYFYFVEMVSIEELFTSKDNDGKPNSLIDRLNDFSGLLDKLPKKFDANFIDPTLPAGGPGNNIEILTDGLNYLEEYRMVKKIIDTLPSKLKSLWRTATEAQKEEMAQIARGFDTIKEEIKEKVWSSFFGEMKLDNRPNLPDGKPNPNYNKMVWSSSLRRFENMDNPIRELIKAAKNHLKSSENNTILDFYTKINDCNHKYGRLGATVVLNENGVLVIEVNSFQANQFLNGHTRHCIKDSMSQWQSYVTNHPNKQYYIYNFNIPQTNNNSVIGVTIAPGKSGTESIYKSSDGKAEIYSHGYGRAAHSKNDGNVASELKRILKSFEKEAGLEISIFDDCLKAMTPEEIERRERAKIAEREIVKKGITIEQIEQYVKVDGADINKDNAKALRNAVEEEDFEKTKLCLELGASPNLNKGTESIIAKAKNLEIIKLLVSYGSDITGEVFDNIQQDSDAVEYCLRHGLDPNFGRHLGFRKITKADWKSPDDIGRCYFETYLLLMKYGGTTRDDRGKNMILKWASEYARWEILNYLDETGLSKDFTKSEYREAILWISHARKLNDEDRIKVTNYLQSKIDQLP